MRQLKTHKATSVNRQLSHLKLALRQAAAWYDIEYPLRVVKATRVGEGVVRFLIDSEQARLRRALEDAEPFMRAQVLISLATGLRCGELEQLEWSDVDLDRETITVRGTTSKSRKTRVIPKSEECTREMKRWRLATRSRKRVFKPMARSHHHKLWKRVLDRAGIDNSRWHDLRHMLGSKLAQNEVDSLLIARVIGHSNLEMTKRS